MSKHTPGPWTVIPEYDEDANLICCWIGFGSEEEIEDDDFLNIGEAAPINFHGCDDQAERLANAYLMAAAPDLFDALLAARERMIGSSPAIRALIEKTDAAIQKALGVA